MREEEGINRAVMDFKKENPVLLIVSKENEKKEGKELESKKIKLEICSCKILCNRDLMYCNFANLRKKEYMNVSLTEK